MLPRSCRPWTKPLTEVEFRHTWSWRRAFCAGNRSLSAVNVGDITQQNLGNDLDTAYLLPPMEAVRAEATGVGGWRGGVNLTALRMLEDRACILWQPAALLIAEFSIVLFGRSLLVVAVCLVLISWSASWLSMPGPRLSFCRTQRNARMEKLKRSL
jgi:hypothetical protein